MGAASAAGALVAASRLTPHTQPPCSQRALRTELTDLSCFHWYCNRSHVSCRAVTCSSVEETLCLQLTDPCEYMAFCLQGYGQTGAGGVGGGQQVPHF